MKLTQDILAERYPKTVQLKELVLTVRPLLPADRAALVGLFTQLPWGEYCTLRTCVGEALIDRWCREPNYDEAVPLAALAGDRLIGDATLHRDGSIWTNHVGRVRVLVHPEYRQHGVASVLVGELAAVARRVGVGTLEADVLSDQAEAIDLFRSLGFAQAAELRGYARDRQGRPHDMKVLLLDLQSER
jgi:GNAT superfamily N-acetyltransferase